MALAASGLAVISAKANPRSGCGGGMDRPAEALGSDSPSAISDRMPSLAIRTGSLWRNTSLNTSSESDPW